MSDFKVFDEAENPQHTNILDRSTAKPNVERVYFPENEFIHGADMNESATIEAKARTAIGGLIAAEGDRQSGLEVIVDNIAGTVQITDGVIYSRGKPREITGTTLTSVSMVGEITIGYVITEQTITHEDDPDYLGIYAGVIGFEEPGAVRTKLEYQWAANSGTSIANFFPFVRVIDGFLISQDAPPTLSGVSQQIGRYITNSSGNFISEGCNISALGLIDGKQNFAIEAGTAYADGNFLYRTTANRHLELEDPDLEVVYSEPQTYIEDGSGTATIELNNTPIALISQVTITKAGSAIVSKGVLDGEDDLPSNSITSIQSVIQGGTTYISGVDYQLSDDRIDWLTGGNHPADGTTYDVLYEFLDSVTPSSITDTQIVVSGGVDNSQAFIYYEFSLPRHDALCLNSDGYVVYLKGISASNSPLAPPIPTDLLKLGEVHNTFSGTPTIVNNGTRNVSYDEMRRIIDMAMDTRAIALRNSAENKISQRSAGRPSGSYSDPLVDDSGRDIGTTQTAAVFGGTIQLDVAPTFVTIDMGSTQFLDFVEEPVITQPLVTGCVKINPYQNFSPLPAIMSINPARDFWTESQTRQVSGRTQIFGSGNTQRVSGVSNLRTSTSQTIDTLREIEIDFVISEYGPGEALQSLTFDGIDVTPAGLVANAAGVVSGSFFIPANVSAGRKSVTAIGGSGTVCSAVFTGQGTLEIISLQRLTTVERFQVNPPVRWVDTAETGNGWGGDPDPQAQSFVFVGGRHIPSIDLKICAIGDSSNPVILEIVTIDNGYPTTEVIAQTELDMTGVLVNQIVKMSFDVPTYLPSGQMFAFVVKTTDADHSIAIADRGGFDEANQEWVAGQPYTVGTRFSSSNAVSWTAHQDSDISFTINGAAFGPLVKRVEVGEYTVSQVSDVIVGSNVFLPTTNTEALYELTFGDETPILVRPNQPFERNDYFTGVLKVALLMSGTANTSPIVGGNVTLILGTIATEGTFISTSFPVGGNKNIEAGVTALLPGNSSVSVAVDATDSNWVDVPQVSVSPISTGFNEHEFKVDDLTLNPNGRMKITITGGPGSRPAIATPYAFVI